MDTWAHTKNLALIQASHYRVNYKNVKIKRVKTLAFGWIYVVTHGDLK